jgi:hypothetical protein
MNTLIAKSERMGGNPMKTDEDGFFRECLKYIFRLEPESQLGFIYLVIYNYRITWSLYSSLQAYHH